MKIKEGDKVIVSDRCNYTDRRGKKGILKRIGPVTSLIQFYEEFIGGYDYSYSLDRTSYNLTGCGHYYRIANIFINKDLPAVEIDGTIKLRVTSKLFLVNNKLDGKNYYCKTKRDRLSGVGKKFLGKGLIDDNVVRIT